MSGDVFRNGIIGASASQIRTVASHQQNDFLLVFGINTQGFAGRFFLDTSQKLFGTFQSDVKDGIVAAQRNRLAAAFQIRTEFSADKAGSADERPVPV